MRCVVVMLNRLARDDSAALTLLAPWLRLRGVRLGAMPVTKSYRFEALFLGPKVATRSASPMGASTVQPGARFWHLDGFQKLGSFSACVWAHV